MRVWRISLALHAAEAFNGKGAELLGGRWNPCGLAVVYTAETLSLAALEFFVNFNSQRPVRLVAIQADIPDGIEPVDIPLEELPPNWRSRHPRASTQALGAAWLRAGTSVVLSVPSVLIPQERNYLLNPGHRNFGEIRVGKAEPFSFDRRMWK